MEQEREKNSISGIRDSMNLDFEKAWTNESQSTTLQSLPLMFDKLS